MGVLVTVLSWLMLALSWVALALLVLVGLLLLLLTVVLLVPLRFWGRLAREGPDAATKWGLHLDWGRWLLQVDARLGQPGAAVRVVGMRARLGRRGSERPSKPRRRGVVRPGRRRSSIPWREWLQRNLLHEGLLLLKRVWRSLHLEIRGDLVVGFEDPSLTGLLSAAMAATPASIAPELAMRLDFTRGAFEGWVEVEGRGRLGSLVWAAIRAVLSKPARRIWLPSLKRKLVRRPIRRRSEGLA